MLRFFSNEYAKAGVCAIIKSEIYLPLKAAWDKNRGQLAQGNVRMCDSNEILRASFFWC